VKAFLINWLTWNVVLGMPITFNIDLERNSEGTSENTNTTKPGIWGKPFKLSIRMITWYRFISDISQTQIQATTTKVTSFLWFLNMVPVYICTYFFFDIASRNKNHTDTHAKGSRATTCPGSYLLDSWLYLRCPTLALFDQARQTPQYHHWDETGHTLHSGYAQ